MVDNFYDSKYWETGLGLKVWQLRLFNTILQDISRDMTVPINWFISMLNVEDRLDSETYGGYYAEWNAGNASATIEVEDKTLTMSGMITGKDDKGNHQTLSHLFMFFGDPDDPDNSSWESLPRKLLEFKLWVHEQAKNIKVNPNSRLPIVFLTEHLYEKDGDTGPSGK